jgi:hypothetical protein
MKIVWPLPVKKSPIYFQREPEEDQLKGENCQITVVSLKLRVQRLLVKRHPTNRQIVDILLTVTAMILHFVNK